MKKKLPVLMISGICCLNLMGCVSAPLDFTPIVADSITTTVMDATESQESKDRKAAWLSGHYEATKETTDVLRKSLEGKSVAVGAFESFQPGLKNIACRLNGDVYAPRKVPFSDFIRDGLIENLKTAGGYNEGSQIILSGKLNSIDFSSHSGYWTISMTISSSNGKSLTVSDKYEFETGFGGVNACNDVRTALMPAVHDLFDKVFGHPEFATLL
ncbi:MAG: hypothetical protein M0Z78_08690 [Betaproteobacteria bacterium]|nr:hypothetical protein [Betaproteobacteria bacterium]